MPRTSCYSRNMNRMLLAAVFLWICSTGATWAEIILVEKNDFTFFTEVSCANGGQGETVSGEVVFHTIIAETIDSSGGSVFHAHFQFHGQGEGAQTGDRYRLKQNLNNIIHVGAAGLPVVDTNHNTIRVVSAGPGSDFLFDALVHTTINANGEASVQIVSFTSSCD